MVEHVIIRCRKYMAEAKKYDGGQEEIKANRSRTKGHAGAWWKWTRQDMFG